MASTMLVLQPTFDEQAEPVALYAALTLIGRAEPQLARFGVDYLAGLEDRHARIIQENGTPQLLDLSASGATLRNGSPVGAAPVALSAGDLLQFGTRLEFRVEPMPAAVLQATRLMTERMPTLQLLLTPLSDQGPAAPIAVTEFPFLVSSSDGHFASYQTAFPDPVSFLSRRHAHVYQSEDQLLLEDLGSTNGTRHNGEPLKDLPVPLGNGDEIRFGHRSFTFQVAISEQVAAEPAKDSPLPQGTVMISSAGSYLDVYCDNAVEDDAAEVVATNPELNAAAQVADSAASRLDALRSAARVRWQQWPLLWARQLGVLVLVPALLLGLGVLAYTRDTRLQDARTLLDREQPQEALAIAAGYLNEYPDAAEAARLVETAFEAAVLPGWIERMQTNEPALALEYLEARVQRAPSMADTRTTALLRWMAELDAFLKRTDGAVTVSVGASNRRLQDLAAEWRSNADNYTRLLARHTDAYADLAPVHTRAMSSIRAIQGEGTDQLKAVAQLQAQIAELIAQSQFEAARARVAEFAADHPELKDLDAFGADLSQLASVGAARNDRDLARFLAETENPSFATAYFGKSVSALAVERRQALDVQQQLGRAKLLWREGKLQPALEALAAQSQNPWSAVLDRRRNRYANLEQGFVELLALVGSSGYPDAVIDFYVRLDASADAFMHQALADDFTNQRDRAVANAAQLATEGADLWSSYKERFQGIGGGLRLESEVSQTYRELAGQLTDSVRLLHRAHRLYQILEADVPATLAQQRDEAVQEVLRQRSALADLRYVLGEGLVQEKLDLLPSAEWRS
ncbi:MAG: FHA domain-containing protein [Pseudomonadota bacterium]